MRAIIYVGLEFARIGNASEDMLKIVSATKQALGMIAQESKLNAARVKKYGINPEIQTAAKRKDSRSSPLKEAKEKGRPASQCE